MLSYRATICIIGQVEWPEPKEPDWKRAAIALEYWFLTVFVLGAFLVGLWGALSVL